MLCFIFSWNDFFYALILTRTNAHITHESIAAFIETLDVAETVKEELRALAPSTYTGVFR